MSDLAALLTKVRSSGASLEAEGEGIRVNGTSRLPASLLDEIKAHKPDFLAYLPSSQQEPTLRRRFCWGKSWTILVLMAPSVWMLKPMSSHTGGRRRW